MNRNPYVILGIPFGASRAEANVAFARRARVLQRHDPAAADRLTDLTWALQRIDEALRQPATALDLYRIPADPAAFQGAGDGVLRPPPERLRARPGDPDQALSAVRQVAAREFLRSLAPIRAARISLPPP